jgi:DNA invertase Pin-like site-specific DNA recombinase
MIVGYVAPLKGTMSEAELHILKERMHQGKLNKARRGELIGRTPIGYVRLPSEEWAIDHDEEVQAVVRLIFDQFDRLATLHAVLGYLVRHGIRIPVASEIFLQSRPKGLAYTRSPRTSADCK